MKKEKCPCCKTGLDPEEIYTDFFYCGVCHRNFPYPISEKSGYVTSTRIPQYDENLTK